MNTKHCFFYCCLLQISISFGQSSTVKEISMDIIAKDGIKLKATYYSPGKPGPGMLLFHQCNMDRKCWSSFARALSENGVHALAFDFRGYGESPSAGGMWSNLEGDMDSAFSKLIKLPGVNGKIAAGGASCGVGRAVDLAIRTGKIKALMLLTGPVTDDGLKYLKENKKLAIFSAASDKDDAAIKYLKPLVDNSTNPMSKMIILKNGPTGDAGHGVPLFKADSSLMKSAVDFIMNALK
jgi:alpha-beta hydrolase superfamily lysophospholipase